MTTFTREKFCIDGVDMRGESSLPPLAGMVNVQQQIKAGLDEDDNVYIGYGFVDGAFPYKMQDKYTRKLEPMTFESVVLENEYLKARFIPALGGRLWSLWDKKANKELTFANPVFRPGNLGIRNAWFSGGIEWNFGMVGHHPFTCSPVFTASLTAPDGTPVLRIYEYERVRCCTYQVDFMLPEDSPVLLCRTRIVNPTQETVPVYWWSNIAVPELKKGRVLVGSVDTYVSRGSLVKKTTVPVCGEGYDCTYPVNSAYTMDYFWRTEFGRRRYVSQVDENGYGLIQTSTDKMLGRKLFVWGQRPGGATYQRYLSGNGCDGRYVEIQAGLAQTQYECVPMPPKTAWEWMEAYGAVSADADKVHGEWSGAKSEVEARLDALVTADWLEKKLAETKQTVALQPAESIICAGSGWGALENYRRQRQGEQPLPAHLDFDAMGEEQEAWAFLLDNGRLRPANGAKAPDSYMLQKQWTRLLEAAASESGSVDWHTWYQLALVRYVERDHEESERLLQKSLALEANAWNLYALAQLRAFQGALDASAQYAEAALEKAPADESLAKECVLLMLQAKKYTQVRRVIENLPADVAEKGRIRLAYAIALIELDDIAGSEEILLGGGGLDVPDIREGENSVTDLWFRIEEAKARRDGRVLDRDVVNPPQELDYRVFN